MAENIAIILLLYIGELFPSNDVTVYFFSLKAIAHIFRQKEINNGVINYSMITCFPDQCIKTKQR